MKKTKSPIKNPYTLRMRVLNEDGTAKEWVNIGTGQFISLRVVENQLRILKRSSPNNPIEVEFLHEGKLKDIEGNVIGKGIRVDTTNQSVLNGS